jgi:predicted RecB family nuclease
VSRIPTLCDDTFTAFLKCRYKAHLKLTGATGEPSEYERLQARLAAEYRLAAQQEWLRSHREATVAESPPSLLEAMQARPHLILNATASDAGQSCHLDALERVSCKTASSGETYAPILFTPHEQVTHEDRFLLAFDASVLARVQGARPDVCNIVHGPRFAATRVRLEPLAEAVRNTVEEIAALRDGGKAPPLVLNKHCAECEFKKRCRLAATEKDDLSLLGGLSGSEIAAQNAKGVFTVTQFSYAFRPARLRRVDRVKKHDWSLQALAVREGKVFVARRPDLPDVAVRAYLDVEGLPDRDFYYLIGLTVVAGGARRHLSFWADRRDDEAAIWSAFLDAVRDLGEDYTLYHYGCYESRFLDRMAERHGGDAVLFARLKARSINLLSSAIYARVYFPAHGNDLKSVAACLGFRWSSAEASGLQAIVWRHTWEETGDEAAKHHLLTYNGEDCSALEAVAEAVRSLGKDQQRDERTGPPLGDLEDVAAPYRRKFGTKRFALPEFAHLTKCAYFDYQRDKVLCRTNQAVKKTVRRLKRPIKKRVLRVNREVECGRPRCCPHCGSARIDLFRKQRKVIIDLKPSGSGFKRCVTRYKANRYRCPKCWNTFLPADYLAMSSKYGWGVCAWAAYSSISLRQSNEAIEEALEEFFGVRLGRCYASRMRRRAAERYQAAYAALLASLREGPLVHADETRARIKGQAGDGYVWAFANPETAVYVYAPNREGDTARRTLAGFKGVLVSDFYAAYDSLDCPQQKCLIHLIRDFNDDLLHHPFDEELRQAAARFTAVLQAVVGTVDRFGLKKHHLHKHKKDVERYFAAEAGMGYRSELARHYRTRVLKYRDKLFTFLDHDGVPWNNNMAENAIKRFASRRKIVSTAFTEVGIQDYLLLLSISQTLRYRGLSFWKFLLSGETDIAAFTAKSR